MRAILKLSLLLSTTILLSSQLQAEVKVDGHSLSGKKVIGAVTLHNARVKDTRIVLATQDREFPAGIDRIFNITRMFDQKCNNTYKNKRWFMDKKARCPFHNENLVESLIIRNVKKGYTPEKNEVDRYIVKRHVYNTGNYSHNDLLLIKKYLNKDKEQVYELIHRMIDDKETKKYISKPIKHDSVFKYMQGIYKLISKGPNKTRVEYSYLSKTDHWMLNKDVVVDRIYRNTARGTILALDNIKTGLEIGMHAPKKQVEPKPINKK